MWKLLSHHILFAIIVGPRTPPPQKKPSNGARDTTNSIATHSTFSELTSKWIRQTKGQRNEVFAP